MTSELFYLGAAEKYRETARKLWEIADGDKRIFRKFVQNLNAKPIKMQQILQTAEKNSSMERVELVFYLLHLGRKPLSYTARGFLFGSAQMLSAGMIAGGTGIVLDLYDTINKTNYFVEYKPLMFYTLNIASCVGGAAFAGGIIADSLKKVFSAPKTHYRDLRRDTITGRRPSSRGLVNLLEEPSIPAEGASKQKGIISVQREI